MTITQHAHIYSFHTSNFILETFFYFFLSMQPLIAVGMKSKTRMFRVSTIFSASKRITLLQDYLQSTITYHNCLPLKLSLRTFKLNKMTK
jgi:hypothetical protein